MTMRRKAVRDEKVHRTDCHGCGLQGRGAARAVWNTRAAAETPLISVRRNSVKSRRDWFSVFRKNYSANSGTEHGSK